MNSRKVDIVKGTKNHANDSAMHWEKMDFSYLGVCWFWNEGHGELLMH